MLAAGLMPTILETVMMQRDDIIAGPGWALIGKNGSLIELPEKVAWKV